MKVTRIAYSHDINPGKYAALEEQARRLGVVRSEVWRRYGSMAGVGLGDRTIRDQWLKEKREFGVSVNAWKETVRDAVADIKAHREAAKVNARQCIRRHTSDDEERKRLYTALKSDHWLEDDYLRRIMRRYWQRGQNHTHNQIIVRSDNYTTFERNGQAWLKIPSLEKGKRMAIPLNTRVAPSGTLRVILRHGAVEVHYAIDAPAGRECGKAEIGVDKGYTEAFVDSDGERYGEGLGALLSTESDALKEKHRKRAKLRAIAKNTTSERKRQNIIKNNLGRKKAARCSRRFQSRARNICFQAAHHIVDKAGTVAAEDLSAPIAGKKFSKDMNRRLTAWTKGTLAEALETVTQRRGSTLILVNPAYTSQIDSRHGVLMGRRAGDRFYCHDGVVLQADENAARNVKARLYDPEIDRWTPHQKAKQILLQRTERHRLALSQSRTPVAGESLSTVSEMPNEQVCSRK